MKTKAVLFLAAAPLLHAGPSEPAVTPPPAAPEQWITPTIDIRARYEYGDMDGKDVSHAFTFRERLGLQTMAWNGFSAFVEGEFSQAAVDDYSGGAPRANPYDPFNTVIADPETNELNQAFLLYDGFDTAAKFGRQRLIYDNAALIGNVGWRQNEQTYDAITLANKSIDALTLKYAYIDQVNRIFGSEAGGVLENSPGDVNLFNFSYAGFSGVTIGGYAYLMNFDDKANWDNNTFGLSATGDALGLTLYGELAWQDRAGFNLGSEACYGHFTVTRNFGSQSLTIGLESLGAGFKTPLATVHAFNGYADVFATGRVEGNHHGLADLYVSHTIPICWGIKWTNVLHTMGDNEISAGYGWEYDSVLSRKFGEHFMAIAKFAHFESEGDAFVGASALPTTTRFSVEMNYAY